MTIVQRSIRNAGILSLIIAAVGLYQGESLTTSALVWLFAWFVMGLALWLSYKLAGSNKQQDKNKN